MDDKSEEIKNWETDFRIGTASSLHQGDYKRVLCVCSAGLLRSPTTAWVLGQEPYNFNTRAAGIVSEYALIKVDSVLLSWCDEIVCMQEHHAQKIRDLLKEVLGGRNKKIITLGIPDQFPYREPELVDLIRRRYGEETGITQIKPLAQESHEE